MGVNVYLFFDGRAEQALEFYQQTLGAQVDFLMRMSESPEAPPTGQAMPPDAIMHASFRIGDTRLMTSDTPPSGDPKPFKGFALSIDAADEVDARRKFDALASGGKVEMPLGKTFWSPCFGMLTDKFGVSWMIGVEGAAPPT